MSTDSAAASRHTLADLLHRSAARLPDKTALTYEDASYSFAELAVAVDRTANALAERGVRRGDRVAIVARNSDLFVVLYLALARMGAVSVPINFMLNADEVAFIVDNSGSSAIAVEPEFRTTAETAIASLDAAPGLRIALQAEGTADGWVPFADLLAHPDATPRPAALDPDDVVQLLYTSGTESRPKGAMLTSTSLLSQYASVVHGGEMHADDVELHTLPLYHAAQLHCFLTPALQVGSSSIVHTRPEPRRMIEAIAEHGVSKLFAPPTVWIALLAELDRTPGADLSSLRKGYYGAAAMPMEVLRQLAERLPGLRLWNFYGQTEMSPVATILEPAYAASKLGSAGRPALNVETRVVDDQDRPVPVGTVGEIVHRSPHLMQGYWGSPELTAEAFRGGWFHSGDLGVLDEDGFLTIVDRKKDMINTGGENVASREVEECIYRHPDVAEVAVFGTAHPRWIEAVTAAVVVRDGAALAPEDVRRHCADRLAGFKVPKQVLLVPSLPKNASGKILKRELRAIAAS